MTQGRGHAPQRLSQAVSDLIALRGWAQVQGHARLDQAWKAAAGASIAASTRVLGIRRNVLQVAVGNSPMLKGTSHSTLRRPGLRSIITGI